MSCVSCGNGISAEHGGIVCEACSSIYCCDHSCIEDKYLKMGVGHSHGIDRCPRCEEAQHIEVKIKCLRCENEDNILGEEFLVSAYASGDIVVICNICGNEQEFLP